MADSTLKIGPEPPKENRLGLKALDYGGGKSTLCAGCGHDAVSNQIIRAFYEMNFVVEQNRDAQLRSLLMHETGVAVEKMESIRYYGGFPMSAHHVIAGVRARLERAA